VAEETLLASIDAKLGALLALTLDEYVRATGVARPKPRSVDKLLADAGLTPQQIARLLGKTDRAVQKQLQAERKKTRRRKTDEIG
jgi:predicted transcriptional regulator